MSDSDRSINSVELYDTTTTITQPTTDGVEIRLSPPISNQSDHLSAKSDLKSHPESPILDGMLEINDQTMPNNLLSSLPPTPTGCKLYGKYLLQLLFVWGAFSSVFWSEYIFPTSESDRYVWWVILLRSFSLITLPNTIMILLGMSIPSLPVQPSKITDWTTIIVIRWTTRGIYPLLVRQVLEKTMNNLKSYKNLIRLEIVTDNPIISQEYINSSFLCDEWEFQEMILPKSYHPKNGSMYKARALQYSVETSKCPDDCYILHVDEESVVTEDLYLGMRQFLSQYGKDKLIGQGIITYANAASTIQSTFTHLMDSLRPGDDFARFRFQSLVHCNLVGMKGSFMLIPVSIEKEIGFDHGPQGSITEDAYFAFLNWNRVRWCRGVLEEQSPFTVWDTVKQRRRWASGLWKLLKYHPAPWKQKWFLLSQMIVWISAPLVGVSFISSFILHDYWIPPILAYLFRFNFIMFNVQYIWGCAHLIFSSHFRRFVAVLVVPFLLPFFFFVEGLGGFLGSFFPSNTFQLVKKESKELKEFEEFKNTKEKIIEVV